MITRRHAGFTLVELAVAIVLLGVVAGAALAVALDQQRARRAIVARVLARRAVVDAAQLLGGTARTLGAFAAAGPALRSIAPDRFEFRALLGSSVICTIDASRTLVGIPGLNAGDGMLSSWSTAPASADTMLVYASSVVPDSAHWRPTVLAADPALGSVCPPTTGFAGDPPEPALQLRLEAPLAAGIGVGSSLRFIRTARYQFYHAGDGHWYLGFTDCQPARPTPCAAVQPVSGPYAPGGVRLAYLDSAGAPTADAGAVASVVLTLRAEGSAAFAAGMDSLVVLTALRN